MSQCQLLLSQKITLLCPTIHLIMTQISTSLVPPKHIVLSHNSSWRDQKSTSPVQQKITLFSPKSGHDHKSTSPVPKKDLVLSHISSLYDLESTPPVPEVTLSCSIIGLVMTQYHILLSQKVILFVLKCVSLWPNINFFCPKKSPCFAPSSSGYDFLSSSPDPSS